MKNDFLTVSRSGSATNTTRQGRQTTDAPGGGAGDSNFRLQTIQHDFSSTWPDFSHEYDKVGNITRLTTASSAGTDVQSFSYDHLDRLLTAGKDQRCYSAVSHSVISALSASVIHPSAPIRCPVTKA